VVSPVDQTHSHFTTSVISPPHTPLTAILQVRQLGPFTVNYNDDPDLTVIASLDADTIVLRAFAKIVTKWDGSGNNQIRLWLGNADQSEAVPLTGPIHAEFDYIDDGGNADNWLEAGAGDVANPIGVTDVAGTLYVTLDPDATQGVAEIYALIASIA
jgi:hypothetical protein